LEYNDVVMMAHRIACHERRPASIAEVYCSMSITDVVESMMVLDMIDERPA